jgi:predicted branched-subunit amino acid permease
VTAPHVGTAEVFRMGAARALSIPGIVLFTSFVGFGAFTRATGLEAVQALFMSVCVFALPGQVVLVDQISADSGLWAAAIAVTLTAVRLLPMTVSILPVLRRPDMPIWSQMLISHFVAVTVWIETMRRLHEFDRDRRVFYFIGVVSTLWPISLSGTVTGYLIAGVVAMPVAAALLLLTPFYFLLSLMSAARARSDWVAIAAGVCLGPVFYRYAPGLDLLWTGLAGGTFAYLAGRKASR